MTTTAIARPRRTALDRVRATDQGHVVVAIDVALALVFIATIPGFASLSNAAAVASSAAGLGILALGEAVVVIAKGIDLSVVAIYGVTGQLVATALAHGQSETLSLTAGLLVAIAFGLVNGFLVAFVEVPALFVTLATSLAFVGLSRVLVFGGSISFSIGSGAPLVHWLGNANWLGLPVATFLWIGLGVLATVSLTRLVPGRLLFGIGDKPAAAALVGVPVRPLVVLTYVMSAVLSFIAGMVIIGSAGSFDSRFITNGSQLYDVLAIVVIGGVSLAGGRGTVSGVVAATVLVGLILNAMTLLDLDTVQQSIFKAAIVLGALVLDRWLHPTDDETARSGDL